jgi:4'-phosphopantetheinyl transferase superfamily
VTPIDVHVIDAAPFTAAEEEALTARLTVADRARLPLDAGARRGFLALRLALPQLATGGRRVATARALAGAAVACADLPYLGIDLETRARVGDDLAWVDTAFGAAEAAWLAGRPDRVAAALRLWCRKEAAVKAIATGFAREPREILVLAPRVALGGVTLALHDVAVGDPLFAAVAAPPGAVPGPPARWRLDGDGTLRPVGR